MTGPETILEIKKPPAMGFIFLKALVISPFRSRRIADDAVVTPGRIVLKNLVPDAEQIKDYRTVCGFSDHRPGIIPISYFQTLFTGLLGKFITSAFFPVTPMGLIHIFQSLELKRPVKIHETLDLSCSLSGITHTEKGLETRFVLEVTSDNEPVWKGISTFLTRHPGKREKTAKKKEDTFLTPRETIPVPAGTGRRYARVSGDYNPHHQYTILAKLFGFKRAIAHGMWSLARVVASLEKDFPPPGPARVEAAFKLPIFMPAATTLGYDARTSRDRSQSLVDFELRDAHNGLPHLKGRFIYSSDPDSQGL